MFNSLLIENTNLPIFLLKVIEKCFVGTASRLSGVTFEILAEEVCYYCMHSEVQS